jgi:hypothetical protein
VYVERHLGFVAFRYRRRIEGHYRLGIAKFLCMKFAQYVFDVLFLNGHHWNI